MAKLKVMCARSMHVAVGALGKAFAGRTGHTVEFDFGTVGALQAKLAAGETADVVILSVPAIDKLEKAGALVPNSRRGVAKTFIALCVRQGVSAPDVSTAEAFRRALDSAHAIALSDPGVGGSAGVHLDTMFARAGLAPLVKAKGLPQQSGVEVAKRVVEGKADFGLTLSGEVASVEGAVIAAALPPPFGQDTVYVAGVMASSGTPPVAAEFIAALAAPDTRETWKRSGFEAPGA
jgi:molybdate transport system substrate-binding protein